jgi:hypothetical protein
MIGAAFVFSVGQRKKLTIEDSSFFPRTGIEAMIEDKITKTDANTTSSQAISCRAPGHPLPRGRKLQIIYVLIFRNRMNLELESRAA